VPVEGRKRAPIVETLYDHWRIVVGFAGLSVFSAVGFYVSFVYLVSWLQTADGIPPSRALEINSFSMAIGLPVVIAAGLLSDRFGRKPLLIVTCVLGLVGAVPLFWLLNQPSALFAQFGQLGFMLVIALDRWVNAARRDVVGRTNWRRDCAGVLDHGIGGRHGRDPNVLSRNLPGAIRWGYF